MVNQRIFAIKVVVAGMYMEALGQHSSRESIVATSSHSLSPFASTEVRRQDNIEDIRFSILSHLGHIT